MIIYVISAKTATCKFAEGRSVRYTWQMRRCSDSLSSDGVKIRDVRGRMRATGSRASRYDKLSCSLPEYLLFEFSGGEFVTRIERCMRCTIKTIPPDVRFGRNKASEGISPLLPQLHHAPDSQPVGLMSMLVYKVQRPRVYRCCLFPGTDTDVGKKDVKTKFWRRAKRRNKMGEVRKWRRWKQLF